MATKKVLTQLDLAKLGGQATFKKYGSEHYKKMRMKRTKNEKNRAKSTEVGKKIIKK